MEDTPHLLRFRAITRPLAALFAATLAPLVPAAPPPATTSATTWQAEAAAAELTPAHIEQLTRDKLLIGPQTHRQIFQPYIAAGLEKTRFITSDAALAAYHALFEDSFRELELRRAYTLRSHLNTLLTLPFINPDPKRIARERALIQHILGPALVVLGAPLTDFEETLRPEIERQATLIRTAEAIELPEWLDPPSRDLDSLDYRRCKPISFYVGQPALENYFRAMRWLQLVPLRADRDTELTAWALLAVAISENKKVLPELADYFSSLALFIGPQADRGLTIDDDILLWRAKDVATPSDDLPTALKTLRQHLLDAKADAPLSAINDERREKPSTARDDDARLANIRFRIAPTFALPDAELISQSLDANIRPNGLMIAAFLGSSFAEERMPKVPADDWAKWKKSARALTLSQDGAPRSLYADYVDLLRTLNTPPVENAPAFTRSPAWQAKTVQTQLASWAQARHTYTLQAKLSVTYFGASANNRRPPSGFVEPNPAFWREYTRLVERTSKSLEAHGVFAPSPLGRSERELAPSADTLPTIEMPLSDRWQSLTVLARQLETILAKQLDETDLNDADRYILIQFGQKLAHTMGYFASSYHDPRDDAPRWAEVVHIPDADQSLGIGTSRAQTLHVLYPWHGEELLCVGAVLPYFEEWALTKRLTDDEWKQKLDSPAAPPPPGWIQPLLAQ